MGPARLPRQHDYRHGHTAEPVETQGRPWAGPCASAFGFGRHIAISAQHRCYPSGDGHQRWTDSPGGPGQPEDNDPARREQPAHRKTPVSVPSPAAAPVRCLVGHTRIIHQPLHDPSSDRTWGWPQCAVVMGWSGCVPGRIRSPDMLQRLWPTRWVGGCDDEDDASGRRAPKRR